MLGRRIAAVSRRHAGPRRASAARLRRSTEAAHGGQGRSCVAHRGRHDLGSTVGFNGTQAMWLSDAGTLGRELDGVAATGSHWLRVDFLWSALEAAGPRSVQLGRGRPPGRRGQRPRHPPARHGRVHAGVEPPRGTRPTTTSRPTRPRTRSSSRAAAARYAPAGSARVGDLERTQHAATSGSRSPTSPATPSC